ncbi:hypothetical protein [Amycolatopsis sp. La24]|uniref:hypothetical protein n=1 Tax=Amycolatopsis sp. La24 TaxID=3028304 RepID=UPI0023B1FD11|nr:hypothetical protein [Amycolatopsis sp. La24]
MPGKENPITTSVSIPIFSHPVVETPRPGALVRPQDDRYGGLFRQPAARSGDRADPQPHESRTHRRRR